MNILTEARKSLTAAVDAARTAKYLPDGWGLRRAAAAPFKCFDEKVAKVKEVPAGSFIPPTSSQKVVQEAASHAERVVEERLPKAAKTVEKATSGHGKLAFGIGAVAIGAAALAGWLASRGNDRDNSSDIAR